MFIVYITDFNWLGSNNIKKLDTKSFRGQDF
jgi:hypothetical protein